MTSVELPSGQLDDSLDPALNALVQQAWECYRAFAADSALVVPSVPILYFGDLEQYARSARRIITVGLNPSKTEFPVSAPFARFPAAETAYHAMLHGHFSSAYIHALNAYFQVDPYTRWFDAYTPMLYGLEASFDGRAPNTVLHTDICSPLATDPTWGGLAPAVRARLRVRGSALWHDLVRYLKPHLIIMSVAAEHYRAMDVTPVSNEHVIYKIVYKVHGMLRTKPYDVTAQDVRLRPDTTACVVWGAAANAPFGTVSKADKQRIGEAIKELLDAR